MKSPVRSFTGRESSHGRSWPRAAVEDGPFSCGTGSITLAAQKWGNGLHSQRGLAVGPKEGEKVEKQPTFLG